MAPYLYVTIVAEGGTPMRLANQDGTPYPTTGVGPIVFGKSPRIDNPIFANATWEGEFGVPVGSLGTPAIYFGDVANADGFYQPFTHTIDVVLGGVSVASFDADTGYSVLGDITYGGQLIGAYHDPLTTEGDIYIHDGTDAARLPRGAVGQVLVSTATSLEWATMPGTGTVTQIDTIVGELTGGPITTVGSLGLPNVVAPGTYGTATQIPVFQVDAKGRVIAVTPTTINVNSILGYTPANVAAPLSQFASTTSAQLAAVISNSTGGAGGILVFNNSPNLAGAPTAPTALPGTTGTQIATCGFVAAAAAVAVADRLQDAPNDGNKYVRQNGAWVMIP